MLSDLKRIIDQICRDKGIDRQLLIESLEDAVMSAAKKKYGARRDLEVHYNDDLGELELFQFRQVVEEVEDEQTQISFEEAVSLDSEVQMHDDLGSKMENVADLGRIAAQFAKQVIIQKMKDAERGVIFEMYKDRVGEIVNGIVQRFERGNMIVNLGRTDALLPSSEQMPRRSYRQGDRIRALLLEVRQTSREHQLVLSRTNNEFLSKLFTMEVPEISESIVTIVAVAREPGLRAKIAVSSSEEDVDPVGACVGMKGSRVQNVVQELQGERIDIVPWSPDPAKYVSNALSPAQVSMVVVDEENRTLLVVVPDDQLSLAIGRGGQNVRLASQLLVWKIDVKSEQKYAKFMEQGYKSLLDLECVNDSLADILYDGGFTSVADLAEASPEELTEFEGIDEEIATQLIEAAIEKVREDQAGELEESDTPEEGEETGATDESRDSEGSLETAESKSVEVDDVPPQESEPDTGERE
ncbi:MAG: transcription termination factor NusA [Thermodesulfobacteriota bacterium]|nr:transcription termination factor NusA [Thermodesulfobacteriota bacterium]